jgi:predicted nucleic acid-binding protein
MSPQVQPFVVNTSPLIHLAEAGLLQLLADAAPSVWVPQPVAQEIRAYGKQDPTARALATEAWLEERPVPATPLPKILAWDLGAGESAVLELAQACPGSTAVIDDLAGRRCAEALGIPLRGTVGLVLAAKQAGRLPSARSVLERLRDSGMYLSDRVLQRALHLVGE